MSHTPDVRRAALDVLAGIAPEADLARLDPSASLQEQLDLDSFDFLQFVQGLHEELGVDVPERDYAKVATLDGCTAYLEAALALPS